MNIVSIIDDTIRPAVDSGKVVGMAVGVVAPDRHWVFGIGTTSSDSPSVPNGRAVYEIGSISKVFTSLILADMVERGEVALDDPIQRFLPEGVTAPTRNDKEITLRLLATHASGLPRLPSNLKINPRDPYVDYSESDLLAFLSNHKLKRDPGERAEYSNLGAGLLGWLLARKAGKSSYEELMIERVATPLGMHETRVEFTPSMRERVAQGYSRPGTKAGNWTLRSLAGAGGIRSTVDDMCRFVRLFANPGNSPLASAAKLTMQPQRDFGDSKIGLGWLLLKDGAVFHNGQTGGYHSAIAIHPEKAFGLVILSNTATDDVDNAGRNLFARLAKDLAPAASR